VLSVLQFDQQNSHDQSQNTPHSEIVQKGDTFLYIRSLTKIYFFLYLIYVERVAENVCSGSDRDCFVDQTVLHRLSGCTDFLSVCVFLLLY
jgi:hypothetical protein